VLRNHWGILINAPSIDATANIIRSNTVRDNGRAGVGILGTAVANIVENNNVTGNGLLNLAPSLRFDLFAAVPANNTWRDNQGNANFSAASASPAATYAEAFAPGGCMGMGSGAGIP
jgi:parallel beta-helix repeat protein